MFAYIPGLKVLMPTFPAEYKGMLLKSIEDDNPVVIIEHRWTHYVKGEVPEGYYTNDIIRPAKIRFGDERTIVATSYSVLSQLEEKNADVFNLRVLRPLEIDDIIESVRKTKNLTFIDTGYKTYGIGAEIITRCLEVGLKFSVKRVGIPDHPIPSSRGYLLGLYPDIPPVIDSPDPAFQGPF